MSNTLSKDKEDILNERSLIFYMGSGEDEVEGSKDKVFEAMDEYAQQEAIGFKNWYEKSGYAKLLREQPFQSLIPIPPDEELYNLYLKSKEK